jgi:uncharacterized protein YukE
VAGGAERVDRAQNESKRAIINSAADEIGALNTTLTRSGDDLVGVINNLSHNWQGESFTYLSEAMLSLAEELKAVAVRTKTVAARVKNTAKEVYPS